MTRTPADAMLDSEAQSALDNATRAIARTRDALCDLERVLAEQGAERPLTRVDGEPARALATAYIEAQRYLTLRLVFRLRGEQ